MTQILKKFICVLFVASCIVLQLGSGVESKVDDYPALVGGLVGHSVAEALVDTEVSSYLINNLVTKPVGQDIGSFAYANFADFLRLYTVRLKTRFLVQYLIELSHSGQVFIYLLQPLFSFESISNLSISKQI